MLARYKVLTTTNIWEWAQRSMHMFSTQGPTVAEVKCWLQLNVCSVPWLMFVCLKSVLSASYWAAILVWGMMSKVAEATRGIYCCCQLQNLAHPAWSGLVLDMWELSKLNTSWTEERFMLAKCMRDEWIYRKLLILQHWYPTEMDPTSTNFPVVQYGILLTSHSFPLSGDVCISVVDEVISVYSLYISLYSALKGSPAKTSSNKWI